MTIFKNLQKQLLENSRFGFVWFLDVLTSLWFQDQAVAFEELKKTMETTRAHLQNQLRSKEMECGRLSVQIRVRNCNSVILDISLNSRGGFFGPEYNWNEPTRLKDSW